MELSQPHPFGSSEGRKPTHDFLSLYSHSSAQQDPRQPSQGNNYLKTHDFLQPLEMVGKTFGKDEIAQIEASAIEKPPTPTPTPAPVVEHVLPGGIGTYSISHINSYFNPIRAPKIEAAVFAVAQTSSSCDRINDENSNCSSYNTGSGFTLWEESAAKKGKTGKENLRNVNPGVLEATAVRSGQWGSSSERPSHSSSNNHRGNFSSISSSQVLGQRSQSFMDMIKSAKGSTSLEDELEEEDQFALKKEISSTTMNSKELRVKVDEKSSDQKANTPRSKHSATEQRRRSKINDRFQMLRELIPHGDQKRDKASFLLEVIEYVQFLQDKVQKYEGPFQGWNSEQTKTMPWRNNRIGENFDHSQGTNSGPGPISSAYTTKFDEKPILVSPESNMSTATITNKGVSFPISMQPNFLAQVSNDGVATRPHSDVENAGSQPQSQLCQTPSSTTVDDDKIKEEDLTVEGGTINISSAYSQGLLTTLTQALHSSGVDLSQASISVQIELGKRAKSRTKDNEILPSNQGMKHSRASTVDDSEQAQKKLKTTKN